MANPYIENADRWLAIADTDYLTQFVKAWIPFNAWYRNSYPNIRTDRDTINEIKGTPNAFREKLLSMLNGSDVKSVRFRGLIESLHLNLEQSYIPNFENRISFQKIVVERNSETIKVLSRWGCNYKVEVIYTAPPSNNITVKTMVTGRNNATKYTYSQNRYNFEEFIQDASSSSITENQLESLKEAYEFVNPKKSISLISNSKNHIKLGDLKMVNNEELIAKAIIEILYKLRCILFHGELNPTKENQKAYEPAYYILRSLIKSLN